MFSNKLISKVFNVGRLFIPHNYFYIPLAGVKTKDVIPLPEKPKKPMTSFLRFIQEHRPVLLQHSPGLKLTEVTKKCAEDWKNLHPTIRERYDNEFKKEMELYARKYIDYSMKLTDEQKEYVKQMSKEKSESNRKRKLKKKMKGMNKPKRPMSAFLLYLADQSKIQGKSVKELMRDMKGSWHLLDESEKLPFIKKSEELKLKYREDMNIWEAQMLDKGHTDLVRTAVLKENNIVKNKKKSVTKKKKPKSSVSEKDVDNE